MTVTSVHLHSTVVLHGVEYVKLLCSTCLKYKADAGSQQKGYGHTDGFYQHAHTTA